MRITPNISILNALIRITIGLTVVSWSTAKMVKWPWRDSYIVMAFLGAMKVAEGIVRFCPLTALYYRGQDMIENQRHNEENQQMPDQMIPYNPT